MAVVRPRGSGDREQCATLYVLLGTSAEKFREEFANAAVTQFGSGLAWLVPDPDKKLKVVKTANADTAMPRGITCLFDL